MNIQGILEQTVLGLGYELVDFEFSRGGAVRIFIDTPQGGVTIDDCTRVHHQLSRVFIVEQIDYDRLEVSSPGLDRPLKKKEDFERFIGKMVRLKTYHPLDNQRKFVGRLLSFSNDSIELETPDKGSVHIAFNNIEKARLEPELSKSR